MYKSFALLISAAALAAQNIPLKNWPAPLYWQPTSYESQSVGFRPELRAPEASSLAVSPLAFIAMTPCRVVDTRASQNFPAPFGAPGLSAGPARTFPIQTSTLCSIPDTAQAYSFNVTVVPPGPLGYLTIYPHGQPAPNAVTLDDLLGTIVNNAAIVPAGTSNGAVDVVVNGNTDLVLDINGYYALPNTTTNTATGLNALSSNTTGIDNTANGYGALLSNTSGSENTASGRLALNKNTTGLDNTAMGSLSLLNNTSGTGNTASGSNALGANTTGGSNTASGKSALTNNTTGNSNTADGFSALVNNTTGTTNTASGANALLNNTTGSFNTALGYSAGENIITGSNNIHIGSAGATTDGTAANSGVIRIGDSMFQTSFFAAGIAGVTVSNSAPVLINAVTGQLGTIVSSRRYKKDIQDMGFASDGLLRLRPVTYRYKQPDEDGSQPIDYGLIAEEVADVYPNLVVKNKDGQVESVQYHKLIPMLLNELQRLQTRVDMLEKASDR